MFEKQFKNGQPESLSQDEWQLIHGSLCRRAKMNEEHVVDKLQLSGFLQDMAVMVTTFWVIPVFVATDGKMAF